MAKPSTYFLNFLLLITGLTLALAAGEGGLRLLGYTPFHYVTYDPTLNTEQRPMYQLDAVNGYIVKPGSYTFDYLPKGKHHIRVTIAENGSRYPQISARADHAYLYFIGCSMCFGIGV